MTRTFRVALWFIATLAFASPLIGTANAQLKVVTSTTDLHDIAHAIGGNRINATAISAGYQDPHFVEAKPSFILKMREADVFAFVGLDLEVAWMPLLLSGSRNRKLQPGGTGYLDVSKAVDVIDIPRGTVDRSQGDVHPQGNPHYWLDPANGRRIAQLFKTTFSALDPKNEGYYDQNLKAFVARLDAAERAWNSQRGTIRGKPVVAYHTSWKYFAEYTGMKIVGFMEPKPGVPPSPSHIAGLIQTMKRTGARTIIMEPWYDRKTVDFVARNTGATVVVIPPSVGGIKGQVKDYVALLAYDIQQVAAALR